MALGTRNSETPQGGVGLAGGAKLHVVSVTPPAGVAQTDFTITSDGVTSDSKIVGVVAVNSAANDLGPVYVAPSANLLTIGFAAQDLLGTEIFHISYLTR